MALQGEVDGGGQQWVAGRDEGRQRLARWRDQRLFEGDPFVARQHRLTEPDEAVAVAKRGRDVGQLVAPRLTLLEGAAQAGEGLEEERLDVVRLEASRLGALHVLPDAMNATGIHGVVGQRLVVEQVADLVRVERPGDDLCQTGAHLRLIAVAHRLDQQIAQRAALELELAEDVEDLAAERRSRLLQLVQKREVDIALAGLVRHQVP